MKKTSIFIWVLVLHCLIPLFASAIPKNSINIQDFESEFTVQNHPEEFLPGWSANEIRSTSSRVFQASGEGLEGSTALGIQTIGSFDAEIYIKTSTIDVQNPKISFLAKTKQNGSGNRPVHLYFSFSDNGGETFEQKVQIGNKETFPNADKAYSPFELEIPDSYHGLENLTIKMEVVYGEGSGTSARLFIDDFALPLQDTSEPSLKLNSAALFSPFTLQFTTNTPLDTLLAEQVTLTDAGTLSLEILDSQTFLLSSSTALTSHPLRLKIEGAKEASGKTTELLHYELANEEIYFPQSYAVNPNTLLLRFTDLIEPAHALQTTLYSINGQAPRDIIILDNGYEISLKLEESLVLDEQIQVHVKSVKGVSGKESQDLNWDQTYHDQINFIEVVDTKKIRLLHDIPLDRETTDGLNFNIQDETIDITPQLNPEDTKTLWLDFTPELTPDKAYHLEIPPRLGQRKQPISGSTRSFSLDTRPPQISDVEVLSADQIMVSFTESIDSIMAVFPGHYLINNTEPLEVNWGDEPWKVILQLSTPLIHQTSYELTISGISDLTGNVLQNGIFSFTYLDQDALPFKSLIINEVMAAPKAENPLPYAEYIELFNPGESPISLAGMRLANASRVSGNIPPLELAPKEYVILTSENDQEQFEKYGQSIGVGSWPRFVNGADEVKILQKNGTVLDSLQYDQKSYGSSSMANAGHSLEVVNPYSPCNASLALRPSTDPLLGTPGKANSVFDDTPDQVPPVLLESHVSGTDALTLVFNEALMSDLSAIIWELDPDLKVISAAFLPSSLTSITLRFDQPLKEKTLYSLTVHQLRDCSGNLMDAEANQVKFQVPSPAEAGDILLNEVLYNPRSGMPKFVEIYNHSEKFIDINQWKLANFANETISNRKLIATSPTVLPPFTYWVFTTDPALLIQEYPKAKKEHLIGLSSLPSYPISGGTVLLLSPEEDLMERLDYSDELHHELLRDSKGVSLERLSPDHPVDDPENWHSAASSEGNATPGYKNSQQYEPNELSEAITLSPQVFDPEGIGTPSFTTISYEMSSPGYLGTIRVYAVNGQVIKQICQNALWGNSGFYTWNGTNNQGTKVRPGYYVIGVEITHPNGSVHHVKKTVAIGLKL